MKNGGRRKRNDGPGAEPDGGAEACPGGNARLRWRAAADSDFDARSDWDAAGKRHIHTASISVENAEDGRQDRDRRQRAARPGRGGGDTGRKDAARAAAGPGGRGRGGGGRWTLDKIIARPAKRNKEFTGEYAKPNTTATPHDDTPASGSGDAASLTKNEAEKSVLAENAFASTDYGVLVGRETLALTTIEGHFTATSDNGDPIYGIIY